MDYRALRIVFLGTPEFAVASLSALVESGCNIVGVITAPDKLGGRGRKQVIESPVKKYSTERGLRILQPPRLKRKSFVKELESLKADLQIVVAFRMLPEVVWNMPSLGTYNLHGSLLPKYRGAAPINWAIINGEEETGVTTFKLKHEIDTGNIAFQEKVEIGKSEYLDDIYLKLMNAGASLVVKTVKAIASDTIELQEQNNTLVTKAPKIFHDDCKIDLSADVRSTYNKIRGLSPIPVAWIILNNKKVKIYKAKYAVHQHGLQDGTLVVHNKTLAISCKDGFIFPIELQLEGKKRTKINDFLNGNWIKMNTPPDQLRIQSPWSL